VSNSTKHYEPVQTRERAIELAEKFRPEGGIWKAVDPCPKILPSLLSADDIKSYVENTGLVYPFYSNSGIKSPLKKASYEGKVGSSAYEYDNKTGHRISLLKEGDTRLRVRARSIVFVECDLEFRLPEFIALRFNLHIQHVHRGLLLGTGPLVDPGFHGKLCIPLHNLTDADYIIPLNEGLVWFEFTKTTSGKQGNLGRPPFDGNFDDFSDITKFLDKAAGNYGIEGPVPLRSSLPSMILEAQKSATSSSNAAEDAKKSALFSSRVTLAAGIGAAIGIATLWYTYYSDMNEQFDYVRPQIFELHQGLEEHISKVNAIARLEIEGQDRVLQIDGKIEKNGLSVEQLTSDLETTREQLGNMAAQNEVLHQRINELSAKMEQLGPNQQLEAD